MSAASDRDEAILTVLRRVGGRVALEELVYKTKLPRRVVLAGLIALEEQGLAVPMSWQAVLHQEAA